MGVDDKLGALRRLLDRFGLDANQAGYIGDDVVDLPIMGACGFSPPCPTGTRWWPVMPIMSPPNPAAAAPCANLEN